MTKLHSLNRNELKYLVIIAMLIDHIAWAFVPTASLLGQIMHIIGRLTGPTMAYMLADGYYYTRSVEKYACRLGIFALLSWIPFSYFELGYIGLQFGYGIKAGVRSRSRCWASSGFVSCPCSEIGQFLIFSMRCSFSVTRMIHGKSGRHFVC